MSRKKDKDKNGALHSIIEKADEYRSPFASICEEYAIQFDAALDLHDINQTNKLLFEAQNILKENRTPEYSYLFYSVGTSIAVLRDNLISELESKGRQTHFNVDVIKFHEDALYYLREAEKLVSKIEMNQYNEPYLIGFKMNLYVNLANALDYCGRECMALFYYRKAIDFGTCGMAYGNIARVLENYAYLEGDGEHRSILRKEAYAYYLFAEKSDDPNTYDSAKANFQKRRQEMEKRFVKETLLSQTDFIAVESDSEEESTYRTWCNNNHLFLNTLNDLNECNESFMQDVLQIFSIKTSMNQINPPFVFEMFNQIKEEFVYARFLLYEVFTSEGKVHFADKNTHLTDMFNNNCYSIRIEKLKTAYRTLYSIFDRISFLLNYYLNLGIEGNKVSFKNIWDKIKEKEKNNIALNALHWIFRDFKNEFGNEKEPFSKNIKDLRNALEHKYVSVNSNVNDYEVKIGNDFIYHISESELKKLALNLAKMVREAIIELVIAIRIEEINNSLKEEKVLSIPIIEYPDEYKN